MDRSGSGGNLEKGGADVLAGTVPGTLVECVSDLLDDGFVVFFDLYHVSPWRVLV